MGELKKGIVRFTRKRLEILRDTSNIIASIINLILIFMLERDVDHNKSFVTDDSRIFRIDFPTKQVIYFLGWTEIVVNILMLVCWY
jgi:hypothetical protein